MTGGGADPVEAGLIEKTSPSSIGLPSKKLNGYLSLRQTWFDLRLM